MTTLFELQSDFARGIAGAAPRRLLDAVRADTLSPEELLSIYRNNSLIALERVLVATFPVVCRLVDPRFFAYAADFFIRAHLPTEPCLSEYGDDFPNFLRGFSPASGLPYLGDVAQLEWAVHRIGLAAPAPPIPIEALAQCGEEAPLTRLRVDPATAYLSSAYPIDQVWEVNQPDCEPTEIVLESGSFHLEIRRGGAPTIRRLPISSWIFRSSLARGATLGQATEEALEGDATFPLADELRKIFDERLIVGLLPQGYPH